jgi:LysM repeat protein
MNRKNSLIARILALAALLGAVAAVVVVVNSETANDEPRTERQSGSRGSGDGGGNPGNSNQKPQKKVYVVQEGDTLTVIARENGVPVARIEELNPDIDPQALIPGQELKLR